MIERNIQKIEYSSALYPEAFKGLAERLPLYGVGNLELLKEKKFTIVGSRRTPTNALRVGEEIAKELSFAYTIVTGVAEGGDSAAIEGALKGSGKVICVLPGGFSSIPQGNYPLLERVAKTGLLLSACEYETPVRSFSFEKRNRLLALFGEGVLVLGAAEKSGALITAKYAFQEEKPVFALPYGVGVAAGAGCNALIKSGAYLTETAEDIALRMKIELKHDSAKPTLSVEEEKILTALRELGEAHVTELVQKAGVPPFKGMALLSSLEMKGLAVSVGGNCYACV